MADSDKEAGIIHVLVTRFETQRLPRALALKKKVDQGEPLNELDITFLEEVFSDMANIKPLLDRHPEWQNLFVQVSGLYGEIISKARDNEGRQ